MELPDAAEISLRVASEKRQGMESDNTYNCQIIDTYIRTFHSESYSFRIKQWRNTKLGSSEEKGL